MHCTIGGTRIIALHKRLTVGPGLRRWAAKDGLSSRHCHVNGKFAGRMTVAATVHAATVAQGPTGGQMALDVEHIVDGGMN